MMSDLANGGNDSGGQAAAADGGPLSDKRVAVGLGAIVGGLSTLAATLSLKELLQNNPFIALAVFALLGAFLLFIYALSGPAVRFRPVAAFAIALLCISVAAGTAAIISGPTKVALVVSATPRIGEADPVKLGKDRVEWSSPTRLLAGGDLTLDLTGVEAYYNRKQLAMERESEKQKNENYERCLALLDKVSHLNFGGGAPAP